MNNLIAAGIFGGAAFIGIAFVVAILALAFGTVIMIIRCARNDKLTKTQKTWWILAQLLLFPSAIIYMIVVEKSWFWKSIGTITLLFLMGMFAIVAFGPHTAKAADNISSSLDIKLNNLDDQIKQLQNAPSTSNNDKNCYILTSVSIINLRMSLYTHKTSEIVLEQLADKLEYLIGTNTLNQGQNCLDWSNQVQNVPAKDNKTEVVLGERVKAISDNLEQLEKSPNVTQDEKLCYSLAGLNMSLMNLGLSAGNFTAAKLQPLIDEFDQLEKTGALTKGKNCSDWINRSHAAMQ